MIRERSSSSWPLASKAVSVVLTKKYELWVAKTVRPDDHSPVL